MPSTQFFIQAQRAFYWLVWIGIHVGLFMQSYIQFATADNYSQTRAVLGTSLLVARGAAACLNFDCAILLIPVCRTIISILRGTLLNRIVPFDKNIRFHKVTAFTMVFFTIIHTGAHYFNYLRLEALSMGITGKPGLNPIPPNQNLTIFAGIAPGSLTAMGLGLTTLSGATGHLMILILLIMVTASLEAVRRRFFEVFWYFHHLFIVWYVLLMIHGAGCLIRNDSNTCPGPQTWKWVIGGFALYIVERIMREVRARQTTYVSKVIAHPSKVCEIQFKKPSMTSKPGQYVFINFPDISLTEWHPFTLTSAPEEEYFSVHIRVVGDWTTKVAIRLGALPPSADASGKSRAPPTASNNGRGSIILPRIRVDGPFGTASEDAFKYQVAVLIGAGIGVTPFASILKSIWYQVINPAIKMRLKKVYFIWTCRDKDAFEWFQDLLEALEAEDFDHFLDIHSYLTGSLKEHELKNVFINDSDGYDPVTRLRAPTKYGRPHFPSIFDDIKRRHPGSHTGATKIGVFFCGPKVLGGQIRSAAAKASDASAEFVFSKENF